MKHTTRREILGGIAAAGASAVLPRFAAAQSSAFPTKPILMVVPFGAGTSTDVLARLVGQKMSQDLAQQVVIENRPGAGGTIGSNQVAKSPPDGYTLCMGSIASHSVNQSLMPNIPYNVLRDFTPISLVSNAPNLMVVHNSVPAKTVAEFIELAKKTKGGLSFASAGNGTSSHLAGELLRMKTGAELVHVPYKSGSQAVTDVVAGQVPMLIYQIPAVLPHVQAGTLRAIAATSKKRLEQAPDVPTVEEQGVPDFDVSAWMGLFGPANMPQPIVQRIHAALTNALSAPDLRPQLMAQGLEPVGNTPAEFRKFLEADIAKWAEVVRVSGAKVD
jgi:tripartite-type tricarboxylate transporter receptor subunit TctC